MGFLETMALLVALGGGAYVTVYYVLPALQYMSMAPYYYMQQQQPAATPPAAPPATPPTEPPADEPTTDEKPLDELIEDALKDELEDAGLTKDPPKEESTKKKGKSQTATSSKEEIEGFKGKRALEGAKATAKAKASGNKATGPSPIGEGWVKYEFATPIGIKVVIVDDANIVRDQYYE